MSNCTNESPIQSLPSPEEFYSSTIKNLNAAKSVLLSAQVPEELNLALDSLRNQSELFMKSPYYNGFHNYVGDLKGTIASVSSHDATRNTLIGVIDGLIAQLDLAIKHEQAKKSIEAFMELLDDKNFKKDLMILLLKYTK